MPTYVYKCPSCQRVRDIVKPLSLLNRFEFCRNACEGAMDRQIKAPNIRGDYAAYTCPITGKLIEGRRQHEENLKQHGCRVLEPGEREQNEIRRVADSECLEREIDQTVESFIEALPRVAREQLATEILAGADLATAQKSI